MSCLKVVLIICCIATSAFSRKHGGYGSKKSGHSKRGYKSLYGDNDKDKKCPENLGDICMTNPFLTMKPDAKDDDCFCCYDQFCEAKHKKFMALAGNSGPDGVITEHECLFKPSGFRYCHNHVCEICCFPDVCEEWLKSTGTSLNMVKKEKGKKAHKNKKAEADDDNDSQEEETSNGSSE